MKHISKFKEHSNQIWNKDEAQKVLSQIYTIEDTVNLGYRPEDLHDFLVDVDEFIKYADRYNGSFADNEFESLNQFKSNILNHVEGISPVIYVAPFWFSRSESDLLEFKNVYSDTVYLLIVSPNFSIEEQQEVQNTLKAHECDLMKGESGKVYLRVWWD